MRHLSYDPNSKPDQQMSLTADEICQILKVAKACRVKGLEVGPLKVHFKDQEDVAAKKNAAESTAEKQIPEEKVTEEQALTEITQDMRNDEVATMPVLDPEQYEDLLIQGELESDDGKEETDDSRP